MSRVEQLKRRILSLKESLTAQLSLFELQVKHLMSELEIYQNEVVTLILLPPIITNFILLHSPTMLWHNTFNVFCC